MVLSNHDQARLEIYVDSLSSDENIIGAILHGSGSQSDNYNDIDIALIAKDHNISAKQKLHYILHSPDGFDVRFLHDFPLPIAKNVIQGKLLFNKDYDRVFDEHIAIIQEWEIFRPTWELYLEVSLHGL